MSGRASWLGAVALLAGCFPGAKEVDGAARDSDAGVGDEGEVDAAEPDSETETATETDAASDADTEVDGDVVESCTGPEAEGTACDDGNACTKKDECVGGQCVGKDP